MGCLASPSSADVVVVVVVVVAFSSIWILAAASLLLFLLLLLLLLSSHRRRRRSLPPSLSLLASGKDLGRRVVTAVSVVATIAVVVDRQSLHPRSYMVT